MEEKSAEPELTAKGKTILLMSRNIQLKVELIEQKKQAIEEFITFIYQDPAILVAHRPKLAMEFNKLLESVNLFDTTSLVRLINQFEYEVESANHQIIRLTRERLMSEARFSIAKCLGTEEKQLFELMTAQRDLLLSKQRQKAGIQWTTRETVAFGVALVSCYSFVLLLLYTIEPITYLPLLLLVGGIGFAISTAVLHKYGDEDDENEHDDDDFEDWLFSQEDE